MPFRVLTMLLLKVSLRHFPIMYFEFVLFIPENSSHRLYMSVFADTCTVVPLIDTGNLS